MLLRIFSTDSYEGMPKEGGPMSACFAWSSTLVRFPIQCAEICAAAFKMVGEFLGFSLQWLPIAFLRPSAADRPSGWHLTQLTAPSLEMRGSQKSMFPSFTFSGVMGLSGDGMEAGSGPKIAAALFIRSWSASAAKSGDEGKQGSNTTVKIVTNAVDRAAPGES